MVSTIESFRGFSGYLKIYVDYFLNLDGLLNIIIKNSKRVWSGNTTITNCRQSKLGCKDQESIQSSTTPAQDTNGKVTNSQLDTTNESQEVSPFPAGDHKAHINRRAQRHSKHKTEQRHKISTKEVPPWNGQQNISLEGLNRFNGAPTSPLIQMWIKTHIYWFA